MDSPPAVPERLSYSIAETAAQLGVSAATVRRLIQAGDLPAVRMGGSTNSRWIVPVEALRKWLLDRSSAA